MTSQVMRLYIYNIIKHVHIPMWRLAIHRFDILSRGTVFLGGVIPIGDIVDVSFLLVRVLANQDLNIKPS